MHIQTFTRKSTLVFLASLLLLLLTACSSEYLDAFNPAIDQFNAASDAVNVQIDALNQDNALFEDPAWQSTFSTALSTLKGAAQALDNLPGPSPGMQSLIHWYRNWPRKQFWLL
jgi:hypothetical protein